MMNKMQLLWSHNFKLNHRLVNGVYILIDRIVSLCSPLLLNTIYYYSNETIMAEQWYLENLSNKIIELLSLWYQGQSLNIITSL